VSTTLPTARARSVGIEAPFPGARLVLYGLLGLLGIITVLPILVLVLGSFLTTPPRALHFDFAGLTLQNYVDILTDGSTLALLKNTLLGAVFGTAGAMAIGIFLAWLVVRTDMPLRRLLETITILPMLMSPLVTAFAWNLLASPQSGILNIAVRSLGIGSFFNLYTLGGICFVFAIYYAPYAFLMVSSALRNFDPSLEEAAAICGAGRLRTLRLVVLPLMAPALLSVLLLVFVFLVEIFAIPAVLGEPGKVPFMSVRIWELIGFAPPRINQSSALGVLMLLITMALVVLQFFVLHNRNFVTVTGKGARRERLKLRGWRWPLAALAMIYFLTAVVLPYAALIMVGFRNNIYFSSLTDMLDPSQFSFDQITSTLTDPVVMLSLRNSLEIAAATVIIGITLFFSVAYIVNRTKLRGRQALDFVAMLPIALPGLVIGLGYLWTWISLPIGIYGTLWVMVLAYVSQFSPQAVRAIGSSLVQIHNDLEESARVCGGGFFYTLRRVIVPLSWPGVQSAMILLVIFSFREISTAVFLYTANTQVFSVTMFDYWVQGTTGSVAVMTLLQTVVLLAVILLGQWASRTRRETIPA
jgi:iron(III) transport system permease protein